MEAWERQLDAPFRRSVRRRHRRVMIGAAIGLAIWVAWGVFLALRGDPMSWILWGTVLAGVTMMNGTTPSACGTATPAPSHSPPVPTSPIERP